MPESFEQQAAAAIRNLTVTCVVLAVGLVAALGLASWGLSRAFSATDAVRADLAQQTLNREVNVVHWCGAINTLDRSLTAYVDAFPHIPRLHLTRLDCRALERATLASTKPH